MREITVIKDGSQSLMPIIIKRVRTVIYVLLTLIIVAIAVVKRHGALDPSTMVTNIAVIARVCFPVAVILSLFVKLFLGLFVSSEMCVTSKRVFGYIAMGKHCDIPISDISDVKSGKVILKYLTVTDTDGNKYKFIGIRNAERTVRLVEALKSDGKTKSATERMQAASEKKTENFTATELARYSAYRTDGIITASELDFVKKQLIGL